MNTETKFKLAYESRDAEEFMTLIFPTEWKSISARILETGVTMCDEMQDWAPRWTPVSPTIRYGKTELETHVKSCIYRSHDLLHQLWGMPIPDSWEEKNFRLYKRAQMCGEVTVLYLTEFVLCRDIHAAHDNLRDLIWNRNALPMLAGPLGHLLPREIVARLDGVLHKKIRPEWLRNHSASVAFADDYVPMLEADRIMIDHNWNILRDNNWSLDGLPNCRYDSRLDGLELTQWMIDDFYHLLRTDDKVDVELMKFNRSRREGFALPDTWNQPNI